MDALVKMTQLLLNHPELPNTVIARHVGCDRRRVRRYRRLIDSDRAAAVEHLEGCNGEKLNAIFNPPAITRRYAPPDFDRLEKQLPDASGRVRWRAYVSEQALSQVPAMSYSQFMRCREETLL